MKSPFNEILVCKAYTLIILFSEDFREVYLAYKTKGPYPDTLNGIGGKVEPNESFYECAIRECIEEITIDLSNMLIPVSIEYKESDYKIALFTGIVNKDDPIPREDEIIAWYNISDIFNMDDSELAYNLKNYIYKSFISIFSILI